MKVQGAQTEDNGIYMYAYAYTLSGMSSSLFEMPSTARPQGPPRHRMAVNAENDAVYLFAQNGVRFLMNMYLDYTPFGRLEFYEENFPRRDGRWQMTPRPGTYTCYSGWSRSMLIYMQ